MITILIGYMKVEAELINNFGQIYLNLHGYIDDKKLLSLTRR